MRFLKTASLFVSLLSPLTLASSLFAAPLPPPLPFPKIQFPEAPPPLPFPKIQLPEAGSQLQPIQIPLYQGKKVVVCPAVLIPLPPLLSSFQLTELPTKNRAIAQIAAQYAANGQSQQALQTVQSIADPLGQALALTAIAQHQREGQKEQGLQLLAQALKLVRSVQSDTTTARDEVLGTIAVQYTSIGDLQSALQVAQMIRDTTQKAKALAEIAPKQALAGQPDQAMKLISLIRQEDFKREAWIQVARQYAAAGKYSLAFQIVPKIPLESGQSRALNAIARQALKSGQVNQIIQPFSVVPNDCIKALSLSYLIQVNDDLLAKAPEPESVTQTVQRLELVQTLAHSIRSESIRNDVWDEITTQYVKIGQLEQAAEHAQKLQAGYRKDRLFAQLAEQYLAASQPEAAIALIQKMSDASLLKAESLVAVAKRYTQVGESDRAAQLLSQALAITKQTSLPSQLSPAPFPGVPAK